MNVFMKAFNFLLMVGVVFPPSMCLKSNCGKGNGSNGDLLQRAYVSIVICNDPDYGPMPQLETPGHSQASMGQSPMG